MTRTRKGRCSTTSTLFDVVALLCCVCMHSLCVCECVLQQQLARRGRMALMADRPCHVYSHRLSGSGDNMALRSRSKHGIKTGRMCVIYLRRMHLRQMS